MIIGIEALKIHAGLLKNLAAHNTVGIKLGDSSDIIWAAIPIG